MDKIGKSKLGISIFVIVFCIVCISLFGVQKLFVHRSLSAVQPGTNQFIEQMPGESVLLDRPYEGFPPLVPHSVEDLTPVKSDNQCFECHFEEIELDEGHIATKIPASHFLNEYTGEIKDNQVLGIRYNCLQCHVPQTK